MDSGACRCSSSLCKYSSFCSNLVQRSPAPTKVADIEPGVRESGGGLQGAKASFPFSGAATFGAEARPARVQPDESKIRETLTTRNTPFSSRFGRTGPTERGEVGFSSRFGRTGPVRTWGGGLWTAVFGAGSSSYRQARSSTAFRGACGRVHLSLDAIHVAREYVRR